MADNNTDVRLIGEKLFYEVNVSHSHDEQGNVSSMVIRVVVMMVWIFWMPPTMTPAVPLLPADGRALLSDEAGAELHP